MSITVTEKQELRDIINRRMKKKIEALKTENAAEFGTMKAEAYNIAVKELGLGEYMVKHADIVATIERLQEEKNEMEKKAAKSVGANTSYRPHDNVEEKIESAQDQVFERMLAGHPVGQQILDLKKEQDHMLETVWVATSSAQVKKLFEKVNEVLGESPTNLGGKAADIEPTSD